MAKTDPAAVMGGFVPRLRVLFKIQEDNSVLLYAIAVDEDYEPGVEPPPKAM